MSLCEERARLEADLRDASRVYADLMHKRELGEKGLSQAIVFAEARFRKLSDDLTRHCASHGCRA